MPQPSSLSSYNSHIFSKFVCQISQGWNFFFFRSTSHKPGENKYGHGVCTIERSQLPPNSEIDFCDLEPIKMLQLSKVNWIFGYQCTLVINNENRFPFLNLIGWQKRACNCCFSLIPLLVQRSKTKQVNFLHSSKKVCTTLAQYLIFFPRNTRFNSLLVHIQQHWIFCHWEVDWRTAIFTK